MAIDWITVSAQIVNFLILVWLLQRFLYKPVIRAMDRREQRITERLEHARAREGEAEDQAARYQSRREALDEEREKIFAEARNAARAEHKQMLDAARAEVDEARARWHQQLDEERLQFLADLRREVADGVSMIARKALQDLADTELETRIAHRFIEQLKGLDADERRALAEANGSLLITSTFELEPATRSRLTRAVHEHIDATADVQYRESDDVLCGVELARGGQQIGWSLADYLNQLAQLIDDRLDEHASRREAENA